ncbi:MAG: TIGR03663 family protein, partial [Anaerolineae bacterium]|nr:TIGR03663 family protein [Anaerolineae bacterium]
MATREHSAFPPDSVERAFNRALTRAYTLNWEMIAYAAILVLALVTRFIDLGARVMSHDESLHTYYSWRLYEFGEFSHTPLMHGPLLFHMTALSYFLFGDNDFTSRIYPTLLGVLIVMFPVLFRRWLGRVGAVIASVLLLISPQLLYYSRYIRHDIPTIFFALVMLYALLQYADGRMPRRATWLWVLSAALLGMLASKEVSFIYIALFGSYLALYWLMRVVQDIGVQRRPADRPLWRAPGLQLLIGHGLLLVLVGLVAVLVGALVSTILSARLWIPPAWIQLPLFGVLYLPLALSGLVRSLFAGEPRDGAAAAIMRGLSNGRSALYVILAGVILGAVLALWMICVLDVIKPGVVWTHQTVLSEHDNTLGVNGTKESALAVKFDEAMFVRLLTWIGLPVLIALFVVFLTAVFRFPGHAPLPWRELLVIVLVALITTGGLVMFERRSFVEETAAQPWAVDPNAPTATDGGAYDKMPIVLAWAIAAIVIAGVIATRFLTNWWDFFNRQPVFDVLIVTGTLILPWLSAFPLYWAGYNLEDYNPGTLEGRDTLNAAIGAFVPFLLVAVALGLAWNWKRWLPAAAVFFALFVFFFTTVFSNQYGLATGMVGSLGYWLAQQGVRRGSQPQYYYVLTQLPVYEFLPMIGAMLAGVSGLSGLWRWRFQRADAARKARIAEEQARIESA